MIISVTNGDDGCSWLPSRSCFQKNAGFSGITVRERHKCIKKKYAKQNMQIPNVKKKS